MWSRDGDGEKKGRGPWMRSDWLGWTFLHSIFIGHQDEQKTSTNPALPRQVRANRVAKKWFPDFPRGVWVRQRQTLECPYECLQISRVCFCNCKPQSSERAPADSAQMTCRPAGEELLFDVTFVHKGRDSNGTQGSVMQLLTGWTRMQLLIWKAVFANMSVTEINIGGWSARSPTYCVQESEMFFFLF